jgi:predicted N-acetyltransferase YhbS
MDITLRNETEEDYRIVEELTREAFWNVHVPGCNEHYLVHIMRNSEQFIPQLDFVAELKGKIVGNIMYMHSTVTDDDDKTYAVITFGPISVLPKHQNKGIGSKLIEHSMKLARDMGYSAILIYGDPEYYNRFGFVPAENYGIRSSAGIYAAALQARELSHGALNDISGKFIEGDIYKLDEREVAEFDKQFPEKVKCHKPTQDRFAEVLKMVHE